VGSPPVSYSGDPEIDSQPRNLYLDRGFRSGKFFGSALKWATTALFIVHIHGSMRRHINNATEKTRSNKLTIRPPHSSQSLIIFRRQIQCYVFNSFIGVRNCYSAAFIFISSGASSKISDPLKFWYATFYASTFLVIL
jgi:hypothetical protein